MALDLPDQRRRYQAEDQEEQTDQRDRFNVAKVLRAENLRRLHQLEHGDGGEERRLLEQSHKIIAERRHDGRNRLGDDDIAERVIAAEVQRRRSLPLTARDVRQTSTIDLGAIGSGVQVMRKSSEDETY